MGSTVTQHFQINRIRVVILMGVAGCGKSTIGAILAARLGGKFIDADSFHPPANIEKMASGLPLNDDDRAPWLILLRREVIDTAPPNYLTVLACSALKKAYREILGVGNEGIALVYLQGDLDILATRLAARPNHFMKREMLESQLAILEEPTPAEGITLSICPPAEEIVAAIEAALDLHSTH